MHRLAKGRDKILNTFDLRSTSEHKTSRNGAPEIVITKYTAIGDTTDIDTRTSWPKVHIT